MSKLLQNHPGDRNAKPRPNAGDDKKGVMFFAIILFVGLPMGIAIPVLARLRATGKLEAWMQYGLLTIIFLICIRIILVIAQKMLFKNVSEQQKYYRLSGHIERLSQQKLEALQLDAHTCFHTGSWVETLEYWPAEVRLPHTVLFTTFEIATKEDRLAANDEAWRVLSEKSYYERVETLFSGMHSSLFACDQRMMTEQNRSIMVARLSELTQLPENYINSCWESLNSKPPALVWAFDLQRIVELSRTSFMAGLIPEEKAWGQILKASEYAHALFDNIDDFFNNYRLGHAYWSNDFKRTNEVAQMQKNYNKDCKWAIKEVPWTQRNITVLPEVMMNGCKEYVETELIKNTRNVIGFQTGQSHNNAH